MRHGDDDHNNNDKDKGHRHDQGLTFKGVEEAKRLASYLVSKFGEPDVIYCGPFLRTIETLRAMKKIVKKDTRAIVDNDLSRYFSSSEKKDPSIHKDTMKRKVPITENWSHFKKRVHRHIRHMREHGHVEDNKIVWVITHALVLKIISKYFNVKLPPHFNFLEWFLIRSTNDENKDSSNNIFKKASSSHKAKRNKVKRKIKNI